MGFGLRVTPLVALPIWVGTVIVRARMVCDLLHGLVPLIHVELMTATQPRETLGIAIIIAILAN